MGQAQVDKTGGSNKPLIGILTSILVMDSGLFPGLERTYVNNDYIGAVEASGGVPIMLPALSDPTAVHRQVAAVDALICTGGYDPSPLLYGENPGRTIDSTFPELDEHQLLAIRAADALGKPMLGICRGLQILNIAFGGSLYQDVSLAPGSFINHFQKSRRHSPVHEIALTQGSSLQGIFKEDHILVNSFHHLAVKDLAPGFTVSAVAADGIVEGIERTDGNPIIAVQWHPEMMFEKHPPMRALFEAFVDSIGA